MRLLTAIVCAALGLAVCAADDTVLWWAVPESLLITSDTDPTFTYTLAERGVNAARIRATEDPDAWGSYLAFYAENENGQLAVSSAKVAAAPTTDVYWSSLGSTASNGYYFILELGAMSDSGFVTLGTSEAVSYETLEAGGFLTTSTPSLVGGSSANVFSNWRVSTAPEPTSGLLWLLGGALLALRRRRQA